MVEIREATKNQAAEIARLIMMAMTDECCLYYCAEGCGLGAFRKMMTYLVNREDSQYSYRNTLVAMDGEKVVGISVSYDGSMLHELRRAFIEAAKEYVGKDNSGMDDETQAGGPKYELVTSHTARRSGATNLYKLGVLSDQEIRSITGHQSQKVFESYIRIGISEQAQRVGDKILAAKKAKKKKVDK